MAKNLLNKISDFWGLGGSDDEDNYEEEQAVQEAPQPSAPSPFGMPSSTSSYYSSAHSSQSKNRVVNIHSNMNIKIEVFQPTAFEEALKVVDALRAKKPAIVNLESLSPDVAKKIFDFLNGALYAIDGKAKTISRNIFLMVPSNVEVNGQVASTDNGSDDDFIENTLFNFK